MIRPLRWRPRSSSRRGTGIPRCSGPWRRIRPRRPLRVAAPWSFWANGRNAPTSHAWWSWPPRIRCSSPGPRWPVCAHCTGAATSRRNGTPGPCSPWRWPTTRFRRRTSPRSSTPAATGCSTSSPTLPPPPRTGRAALPCSSPWRGRAPPTCPSARPSPASSRPPVPRVRSSAPSAPCARRTRKRRCSRCCRPLPPPRWTPWRPSAENRRERRWRTRSASAARRTSRPMP